LEGALYGPEFRDPVKGYDAYLDPDSFIDYHWLVEATKNVDGFRFSTFFQKDRGGKLKMGPIWDWNLSFGAANGKQGHLAEYWYWPQLDDQQYSWYRRLFEDPDFAQKYVDRWGELRTNQFAAARILARIDELAALLNEAQERNFRRWRILGRQVWPDFYTGKSYGDEVQYMKNWIAQRLTWIDRQFVAGPNFSLAEGQVATNSKLAMRAPVGKVYYTLDGSDPRALGGTVSAHSQLYKAAVKLNGETVVLARALAGNRWSWPIKARFTCAAGPESVLPR
jgi:CotH kinase protein/Chitobiase/beta-hexosaminidase C-terminal domain